MTEATSTLTRAAVDGVKIYHPGLRRGITRGLRAMIRRRSAIEPAIGHMKSDGKLDRNWLKGALGDAMHAVLCGAGHNLRMILMRLRIFLRLFAGPVVHPAQLRIPLVTQPAASKIDYSGPTN